MFLARISVEIFAQLNIQLNKESKHVFMFSGGGSQNRIVSPT